MAQVIILLILSICLVLLAIFLLVCYSDYRHMKRENQQLSHALESQFILQADSPDAYRSMIREACREGGFWENTDADGNDGSEEY